jgi:hypothetical protein
MSKHPYIIQNTSTILINQSCDAFSLHAAGVNPFPTFPAIIRQRSLSYSCIARCSRCIYKQSAQTPATRPARSPRNNDLTVSSVQTTSFAFSFVQYRTCSVPLVRPGKKSAICFQVRFLCSFSSTSNASSSGENLSFGPRGRGAGSGIPGYPTTLGGADGKEGDATPAPWLSGDWIPAWGRR